MAEVVFAHKMLSYYSSLCWYVSTFAAFKRDMQRGDPWGLSVHIKGFGAGELTQTGGLLYYESAGSTGQQGLPECAHTCLKTHHNILVHEQATTSPQLQRQPFKL